MILLWSIGCMFTAGMLHEESDDWRMGLRYFTAWPYYLGKYLDAMLFQDNAKEE